MIANLITTLLLALGVATGNVSSNSYKGGNAFNNEVIKKEEKPIQKANEQVTYIEETMYSKMQEITYTSGFNTNAKAIKYYLGNNNSNSHIYTQYVDIYNTLYTCDENTNDITYFTICFVMQINNYTESSINDFNVKFQIYLENASNANYRVSNMIKRYNNNQITDLIDRNITGYQSVIDIRNAIIQRSYDYLLVDYSENKTGTLYFEDDVDFTINYLPAHSNIQIGMYIRFSHILYNYNSAVLTFPNNGTANFSIKGTPLPTNINYEVVNVPELMFTIITLPFAFYSTAFNLTIFPGTPYALNFGNLILTIIAALILLYLIKKVLK